MSNPDHANQSGPDIDELVTQVDELVASRELVMIPALPLRGNDSGFVAFLMARGRGECRANIFP